MHFVPPINSQPPDNLNRHHAAFGGIVLKHINETLEAGEWDRFRSIAITAKGIAIAATTSHTPASLIGEAISEDGISLDDTLVPPFRANAIRIDDIEGQPVYYINGEGMYLWAPAPDSVPSLTFWITHPAYPPGW